MWSIDQFLVIVVFILSVLWWIRIRGLWEFPDARDWLWGKLVFVLMDGAMLSNTCNSNFLLMDRAALPPCCLTWDQTMVKKYVTVEQWRNNYRKNEEAEPKWEKHSVVDVAGDGSKVWFCKEQYCIGIWIVMFMNQGNIEAVKQQMARMNIYVLGITELKMDWNWWI